MHTALRTLFLAAAALQAAGAAVPSGMVLIPGGRYTPRSSKNAQAREVRAFYLDATQVTNAQFLQFVREHPTWKRSQVSRMFADASYLKHWAGDLDLGSAPPNAPVTHVSWYAAKAWCEAHGKRLPTQDEWEFTARADATRADAGDDPAFLRQVLEWYAKPVAITPSDVTTGTLNAHGIRGMHGLVWEWVDDFNATLLAGGGRGDGAPDRSLFCGADALPTADASNYAAYMRYAFRSSLRGDYCVASLSFRAAKSLNETSAPLPASRAVASLYDLPGTWRTQDGRALPLSALRGKPRVITMGFTSCKSACPRIIHDMKRIEAELGTDADKAGFVFFSFDSANDQPEKMHQALTEHRLDPRRWTFAVSDDATIRRLAVALNFKYATVEGFLTHSNLIAVLDAEGNILHREETLGADIAPTVTALRKLLR